MYNKRKGIYYNKNIRGFKYLVTIYFDRIPNLSKLKKNQEQIKFRVLTSLHTLLVNSKSEALNPKFILYLNINIIDSI